MPANLPAEAKSKWNEASMARTPERKLKLLEEFLSLVPKHKGNEKLRAQVKTKMSTLRKELREKKRKRPSSRGSKLSVEKEGAAQIVILGLTKAGRSSLLASITNAKVSVSSHPFTTRRAVPGMLQFEDVQLQLVEAPAMLKGASEGKALGHQTLALARNSDGLILMVDLSNKPWEQLSLILNELESARILVRKPKGRVEIERKHMGIGLRIFVIGELVDCTLKEVEALLKSYRISNAIVRILGKTTLDDIEDSIFESAVFRPTIVVANKADVEEADKNLSRLQKHFSRLLPVIPISCETGLGLDSLGAAIFQSLGIMRIYTKEPNRREPSPTPFILKEGSSVEKLAKQIHSDFYRSFSHARVWSKQLPFSPQRVGLTFILSDKDVVEMHVR